MVQVGDYNVKVADARKMLTNFNRHLREDVYSGVWLMNTAQLQNAMKDFKYDKKNGKVKHKTKAKTWEYMVGSVGKKIEKPKKAKAEKPKRKVKKIPEMTKEEEAEGIMEEEEEVKEEKPKPAEKKKRKPSAYAVFMGQQRKKGKSMKEISEMWKKKSKK